MVSEPMRYMWCQCEGAVREIDDTPCPSCRGCPVCGQKLQPGEHCGCPDILGYRVIEDLIRTEAIPEENVLREFHRAEVRKALEPGKLRVEFICMLLFTVITIICSEAIGAKSLLQMVMLATVYVTSQGMIAWLIQRQFRKLEGRLVELEFPLSG